MEENLINIVAQSNMQKAVLANLLADTLAREENPSEGLQAYYNDVKRDLQATIFPGNDPDVNEIRQRALNHTVTLFRDIEIILLRRKAITESKLST